MTIELVTPFNFDELKRIEHQVLSDPDRIKQLGDWSDFPHEPPKNDWSALWFLAQVEIAEGRKETVGYGKIHRDRHLGEVVTLMLALLKKWRGQGYGSILGRLLTRYAFDVLGAEKVEGGAYGSNPASVAMQSGGMTSEGVQRRHYRVGGEYVDYHLFGLTREEWQQQVTKRG